MILPGASGAAAALPFSLIVTATGLGTSGHAWVDAGGGLTAEFKVQCPSGTPGAYVNATIARIVELGGGNYEYQMSAGESADPGKVYYYPNVALHDGDALTARWEDIVDVGSAGLTANAVRDAILDYTLRSGRTVRGHLRRMDALFFGKVTGLWSALVTAFRPGGAVAEFEAVQTPAAGSREEVDVTGSEAP